MFPVAKTQKGIYETCGPGAPARKELIRKSAAGRVRPACTGNLPLALSGTILRADGKFS